MSATSQSSAASISSVDAQRVEDAPSLIAPKWTTWSAQTLAQQGSPMRVRDVAARLPFVSEQLVGKQLAQMHADGLVTRFGDRHGAPYQLSAYGESLSRVHHTLSDWSQVNLSLGGRVAGAERVEDAVRRLHLRDSTAVIQVLDAGCRRPGRPYRAPPRRPIRSDRRRAGPRPRLRSRRAMERPRRHAAPLGTAAPCRGGHSDPHRRPAEVGQHPNCSGPAPECSRAERPVQSRSAAATAGVVGRHRPVGPSPGPVIRVALRANASSLSPRRPRAVEQPIPLRTRARPPPSPPEPRR